jgi:trigger factor
MTAVQITREDLPDRQVALMMEFEPQEIEPALQKTYQRLVQKVNIPGFRPGKAPRQLFERYVGRDALIQEASESLMATGVKDAIEQENLQGAELSDAHIESTDPLRIHVIFDLEPLVEVGDYADIRVEREPFEMQEGDVDEMIDRLRRREAEWHDPAEARAAQWGDRVTIDLETFTIEGPVPEMTGEGQTLELSRKTGPVWPREIDENIVGMQVGEEKDFAITFPEAYTNEDLRGKEATVHVKVTAIQEADLPELDDEFAKRAGQADTVEELRTRMEETLRAEGERAVRSKQVQEALTQLQARSNVEVSAAMIDHEVDHRYERLAADLQQRRIAPARYFTYEGTTEKDWREAQREPARTALKELLVLREFARRENIDVSDDEVEAEMAQILAPYADNPQAEQLRGLIDTPQQREQISNRLFERKLTDRLIAIAEGRGDEPVESAAPVQASGESETADAVASPDAGVETGGAVVSSDATAEAEGATVPAAESVPSGAVPATEQEPGPLETAGGAAEVLGTGEAIDAEPASGPPE